MKTRLRLLLSYEGTGFSGWQRQKTQKLTLQGKLEEALSQLFNETIQVVGASRTDAGVHAFGQNVHFEISKDPAKYQLLRSINCLLPDSMAARQIWRAPTDFHAMLSSSGKFYRYRIFNSPVPNPLLRHFSLWEPRPLDLDFLQKASDFLLGEQDFKSFQTTGSPVPSTIRHIHRAQWQKISPQLLEFRIEGSGFLKQMVRNIVGSLLDLHFRGQPPETMAKILAARNRQAALGTASPHGLFLSRVHYPQELEARCRPL